MSMRSHPTRGAWIEIPRWPARAIWMMSHPTRGAWIEITSCSVTQIELSTSHPTRGAWIEISVADSRASNPPVAPHTGCVD